MTRTKSSRALVSVVLAVLMAVAFMPAISYTSFAATAKKATKVTKVYHTGNKTYTRTVGSAWTLKYKLSPSKLTTAAKKVVWKSSNKSVVNVSAKSGNKAAVSFKKVGTATVTVYTKANKKAKATWKFKVVPKAAKKNQTALTGVTVSKNGVALTDTTAVKAGQTLTATVAPAGATASYQWYADDAAIEGATAATFTVTNAQAGKAISVKATGVGDYKDTVTSAKSAKVTANPLKDVTISTLDQKTGKYATADSASVGDTLYAVTNPEDLSNAVSYQWYQLKNGKFDGATPIKDATKSAYTLTDSDAYEGIGVIVTTKGEDGKDVTKEDILGTMTTTVKPADKTTSVKVSTDGKTEAKAAKVGDTLTALVKPAAAATDANINYQWYVKDNGKWTAISGETKSTYTPAKAGTYGVEIRLTGAAQRDGYTTTNAGSFDTVTVSAKDFTGVSPYIHDIVTEGNLAGTTQGTNANSKSDAYSLTVQNLVLGTDYNVAWKIDRTENGTTTTYTVVDQYGNDTENHPTINYVATGNNSGKSTGNTIKMRKSASDAVVEAQAGDKLYAVITGADNSAYVGQTAESNKITLTNGEIQNKYQLTAKNDPTLSGNAAQYTATLSKKTNAEADAMTGVNVAWYSTNDEKLADSFKNGADITDAQIAALSSLKAPSKTTAYTGNLNEGGKYVIAVVTRDGYNGRLAYAATKEGSNELFEVEENKGTTTDALAKASLVAEKYTGNAADKTQRINVTVNNAPQGATYKWFWGSTKDSIANEITNLNPAYTNNNKDGEYGKVEITSGGKTRTITYSVSVKDSVGNITIVSDTTK